MRRCTRCILPDSIPGIEFNSNGVCNFCESFTPIDLRGEEALAQIIQQAKQAHATYDCIVPLSGGRDSMYVLYVAKRTYDMNILAINYNNEFRVPEAYENMVQACEMLSVDFESIGSQQQRAQKVVQYDLQANDGICSACVYGYHSVVYSAAEEHKVPLIIWGNSSVENTGRMRNVINKTVNPRNTILDKIRRRLHNYTNPYWYGWQYHSLQQRLELPIPGRSVWKRKPAAPENGAPQEISLFDYIEWDREAIKNTISRELGWQKPEEHSSTWRIDCYLHSFENWKHIQMYGCTKDAFGYCNMINAGHMTRKEALEQEEAFIAELTRDAMKSLLTDTVGLNLNKTAKILSGITNVKREMP